jgi:hypothetical protein
VKRLENLTTFAWAAEIGGETSQLEDLAREFARPFEPSIEERGGRYFFRSEPLALAKSPTEAHEIATAELPQIIGALALSYGYAPIVLTGVAELGSDGTVRRHIFASWNEQIRVRVRGTAMIIGPDGQEVIQPPAPSVSQRLLSSANQQEALADALAYLSKGPDWFDIYKALECLFHYAGGEDRFLGLGFAPSVDIKRLKRTANDHRHARLRNRLRSEDAMPLSAGYDLLRSLVRHSLEQAAPKS